jgi:hypothetical protein
MTGFDKSSLMRITRLLHAGGGFLAGLGAPPVIATTFPSKRICRFSIYLPVDR